MKFLLLGLTFLLIVGFCFQKQLQAIEEPVFDLIKKDGVVEIRDYKQFVSISTEKNDSESSQFRRLAAYIFGKNQHNQKIEMTVPVLIDFSQEKRMYFMMPKTIKFNQAPKPNSQLIKINNLAIGRVAVIRFSGYAFNHVVASKKNILIKWLDKNSYSYDSSKQYLAQYNPPWVLPMFRRNELWVSLH